MGGTGQHGIGAVHTGQVHDAQAVAVGDLTGALAGSEGNVAVRLDVQHGVHHGLLVLLGPLQSGVALHSLLAVLQREGVGGAGAAPLVGSLLHGQADVGGGDDDLLVGERLIAVQGFLHGFGDNAVGILRSHPADQAAQALIADVLALIRNALGRVAGEEVAGLGAVEVGGLRGIVPVLLQLIFGDQLIQLAVSEGAAGHAVLGLHGVGIGGGEQAGAAVDLTVVLDAAPASGVGGDADHDLGIVDLIAVGVFQILDAGIHGEHAVGLGLGIVSGVGVQSGLVAGVGSPSAAQVVGHHVQEVHGVQDLVILNLRHLGGRSGHGGGQLIVFAVGGTQLIQLAADVLHQQSEVLAVLRSAGAALVDGNAVALGIRSAHIAGILPVDVDKVKAQVIHELGNVLCEVLPGCGIAGHGGEITGTGPAAHGDADLHVGVLVAEDDHAAQNAAVGGAIGKASLLRQKLVEVRELVAEDQVTALIHVHEREVQMGDLAAVNVAGVEVVLARINRPVAIIHDVPILGGFCGVCFRARNQDAAKSQDGCQDQTQHFAKFHSFHLILSFRIIALGSSGLC